MGRTKSLTVTFSFDNAGRAHNCQANARHRIQMGDLRLKVSNDRGHDHYCIQCAKVILGKDIEKLRQAYATIALREDDKKANDSKDGEILSLSDVP